MRRRSSRRSSFRRDGEHVDQQMDEETAEESHSGDARPLTPESTKHDEVLKHSLSWNVPGRDRVEPLDL